MNISIYRFTFVFVALSFLAITGCTSGNQNPSNITTDVANKLTENITFDNGTFVSGAKPVENTASELILKSVVMPDTIEFGKKFDIELYTDYAGGEVEGAVMYVPPANVGYVQITASLEVAVTGVSSRPAVLGNGGKYVMHLSATIQENALYTGKIPKLEFALYKNLDGGIAVGNYASHETKLPDAPDGGEITDAGSDSGSDSGIPMGVYTIGIGNGSGTIYIGGAFSNIGGQARNNIAAIDAVTGTATSWNPNADNGVIVAIAVSGDVVYSSGLFSTIGGQARNYLAALDSTSGDATTWNPNPGGGPAKGYTSLPVTNISVSGDGKTIYLGGWMTTIGGETRKKIAAVDANGIVTSWNPDAGDGDPVNTIALGNGVIYAGGGFQKIGGQMRSWIASLDATTGLATAWNPSADSPVRAIVLSGDGKTIYVGGQFSRIGGQMRNCLASFDAVAGTVTSWNPDVDERVSHMAFSIDGKTLYVVGKFTTVGGQARNHIAAIDTTTGLATAWNPNPDDEVGAISVSGDGKTVYVGGSFTTVGGQNRNRIAAIDATTGLATGWNPDVR